MKVIFITGLGRSGTNLLDLLLGSNSQVEGLGEIQRLANSFKNDGGCSCGVSRLRDCELWSQVDHIVTQKLGVGISSLELESRDTETFDKHNRAFFEAVGEVSGTEYITDNSKSPRRLQRLLAVPGLEVTPLQITRDPRGCAYSQFKRKNQYIGPAITYTGRHINLYRILRNRPHISVDYEHLARDPEKFLNQLTHQLNLQFEPQMLEWAAQVHHNIGSAKNVLRKAEGSEIRMDNTWQSGFPKHKQAIINLITWPAKAVTRAKRDRLESGAG